MRAKTSIYDFSFIPSGYGHYKVTYTSPVTGKQWTATTNDMPLIDANRDALNKVQTMIHQRMRLTK